MDGPRPNYVYVRLAKVRNNFPIGNYEGPSVVAFMNPESIEIAMPPPERTPYGSADHVLHHEILHVYAALAGTEHNERGFNDRAVEALRHKSGHDRFPFSSY